MKRVLMLHQRGRWEMKLSAPSICLAHPSIHLGQPAGRPAIHPAAAAAWKKKEAVYSLGEASHLKLLRWFSRGKRTAPTPPSFPRGGRLGCRGLAGEKKADLSWSASSTWFNTERLSYPGQPVGLCACVCIKQFCDTCICRGTRTLVSPQRRDNLPGSALPVFYPELVQQQLPG